MGQPIQRDSRSVRTSGGWVVRSSGNIATLISLEQANVQAPEVAVYSGRALRRFGEHSTTAPSGVDTQLPYSAVQINNSPTILIANQSGDGSLRVRSASDAAGSLNLSSYTNSYSPACLHAGWDGSTFYYATWSWGGQPTVYSATWNGSALGGGTSLGTIPVTTENSGSAITRVESVQPVGGSGVIVAVGHHVAPINTSTIEFFLVTGGQAYRLKNIIQWHYKNGIGFGQWYQVARWAAHVHAIETDAGREFTVVANGSPNGAALQFWVREGVESSIEPAIWTDPMYSDVGFVPTGLCSIGQTYVLSGRFIRPSSDNLTTTYVTGYSVSSDGRHWSAGSWNSFVTAENVSGAMVQPTSSTPYLYYIAPGRVYRSSPLPGDSSASPMQQITAGIASLKHQDQSNGINSLEVSTLDTANIEPLTALSAYAGYSGTLIKLGDFIVDRVSRDYGESGVGRRIYVSALDTASWLLKRWASPIDVDRWTATIIEDDLKKATKVIYKCGLGAVKHDETTGLLVRRLNDPVVAYASSRDERDGIAKARVTFAAHDGYALSTFGFVIGGGHDGFNTFVIPMTNSWTGYTLNAPQMRRSNLDPQKKFSVARGITGLVATSLTEQYAKMTLPADGEYLDSNTWTASSTTTHEFVCRVFGGEVQIYARTPIFTEASIAGSAAYMLIRRFRFGRNALKNYDSYWGITASVDTWCSTTNNMCGEYEDVIISLTSASELIPLSSFTTAVLTAQRDNVNSSRLNTTTNLSWLTAGQTIRLYRAGVLDTKATVLAVGANYVDIANYRTATPISMPGSGGEDWTIYVPASLDQEYALTRSGYVKQTTQDGVIVTTDPPSGKMSNAMIGRGAYISDDSTAISPRVMRFDGLNSYLVSGSHYINGGGQNGGPGTSGGTFEGFDMTSPLAQARDWRLFFPHGYFFAGQASQYGLPNAGYFMIDDEIMRYLPLVYYKPGARPGNFGTANYITLCPVWIAPLAAAAAGTTVLYNKYFASINKIAGDDIGRIGSSADIYGVTFNPAGLLVEIHGRNSIASVATLEPQREHRVASVTPGANTSQATASYLTLQAAYPNEVVGPGAQGGDIIKVSGRAALGTKKTRHRAAAPLVYYPASTINQKIDPFITISRADYFIGRRQTAEDALKYVCGLVGIRSPQFSSSFYYAGNLGSGVTVNVSGNDHVVEYIGPIHVAIDFQYRGGINVQLQGLSGGEVRVRLHLPGSNIAPANGYRLLEQATIPVSSLSVNGSNQSHVVRLITAKNIISLELDDQPLWSFNLDAYNDIGINFSQYTGGLIVGSHNGSSWSSVSVNCIIRVPDLGGEVENLPIDMGTTGDSALSLLMSNRYIYARPTQDGSYYFTNYRTRDDLGSWTNRASAGQIASDGLGQYGHVSVVGLESSDHIDAGWIYEKGYSFSMANNHLLRTPSENAREAAMLVKLSREQSGQFSADMPGMPQAQSGDMIGITQNYGATSASFQAVVDSHTLTYRPGSMVSSFGLMLLV